MKILVTGCSGFIGHYVVAEALRRKHLVSGLDIVQWKSGGSDNHKLSEFYIADITSEDVLREAVKAAAPDAILHLAAKISVGDASNLLIDTNVRGTENVIEVARALGVKRLVFASSAAVYGNRHRPPELPGDENWVSPTSTYGLSKLAGEMLIRSRFMSTDRTAAIMRLFNVFGEGMSADSVLARWIKSAKTEGVVRIYDGGGRLNLTRDLIYVGDVARTLVKAAEESENLYANVCTGQSTRMFRLAQLVASKFNAEVRRIPPPADRVGEIEQSSAVPGGWRGFIVDAWTNVFEWVQQLP